MESEKNYDDVEDLGAGELPLLEGSVGVLPNYSTGTPGDEHLSEVVPEADDDETVIAELSTLTPSTYRGIFKECMLIAIPMGINRLIGIGAENIGRLMLGRLGAPYLAASSLFASTTALVVVTTVTSVYGMVPVLAEEVANERYNRVGSVLNVALIYSIGLGSIEAAILSFSSEPLQLLGQNQQVADITQQIFRGAAVAVPAMLVSSACQQACFTIGKPLVPLGVNLIRRLVFLGAAYVFIFGELGFPRMEAAGLGLAETISISLDALIYLAYFRFCDVSEKYQLLRLNTSDMLGYIKPFLREGFYSALQMFTILLTGFVNTTLIGSIDVEQLAAWEINNQYNLLMLVPIISLAQAVLTLMKKTKAEDLERLWIIEKMGYLASSLSGIMLAPVLGGVAGYLSAPFTRTYPQDVAQEVTQYATSFMRVTAEAIPFNAVSTTMTFMARARNYRVTSALVGVFAFAAPTLLVGPILAFVMDLGSEGLNLGLLVGFVTATIALIVCRATYMGYKRPEVTDVQELSDHPDHSSSTWGRLTSGRGLWSSTNTAQEDLALLSEQAPANSRSCFERFFGR